MLWLSTSPTQNNRTFYNTAIMSSPTKKRLRDDEDLLHVQKRPLSYQPSPPQDAEEENSPVLFRDDTAIMTKPSLDSTKSLEWLSTQITTPVPAEQISTISIDNPTDTARTTTATTTSIDYSPEDHRQPHHSTHHLHQQEQQHRQHQQPLSYPMGSQDVYTHHDQQQHQQQQQLSREYAMHHQDYTSIQAPYVDYSPPPYHHDPYIPPPPPQQMAVQHHYSYEENVMYPPSSSYPAPYYNYPYTTTATTAQAYPPEYSYYPTYYSSDPRMYSPRDQMNYPSTTSGKPETLQSIAVPQTNHRVEDPRFAGVSLYLPCDEATLSAYQCLVRQQIEFFSASTIDVEQTIQGRNKKIEPGQVGIRCRHCKHVSVKKRARGAMYYPSKLSCIYQMAQNMASVHLNQACEYVPRYIRETMENSISDRKSLAGSGKEYWATGARSLGIVEVNGRLMFAKK